MLAFAALKEANYLANFIDTHISCINHIPAELLGKQLNPAGFITRRSMRSFAKAPLSGTNDPNSHFRGTNTHTTLFAGDVP